MSLVQLWRNSTDQVSVKRIDQVLAFTGDGSLRDGNVTSSEFREFLSEVPRDVLSRYATECLETRFADSGLALQDVVNETGRRLGFEVDNGRYRGTAGDIGFDGLWKSPYGDEIVVEAKTTDTFGIDLDTVSEYRRSLIRKGRISEERSSILLIVGRDDTGNLEAQIRGSRHAWDVRLLSVEALFRLASIREEVEGPSVARKIVEVLVPREYTRVDGIIDLVFAAAAEVRGDETVPEIESAISAAIPESGLPRARGAKPKFTPVNFHSDVAALVAEKLGIPLIKKSMATFTSPDSGTVAICAASREHPAGGNGAFYWYAFHPHQRKLLSEAKTSYVAFGCGSAAAILLIPFREFDGWIDQMNMTRREDREYWHVHIFRDGQRFTLHRRGDAAKVDLSKYLI